MGNIAYRKRFGVVLSLSIQDASEGSSPYAGDHHELCLSFPLPMPPAPPWEEMPVWLTCLQSSFHHYSWVQTSVLEFAGFTLAMGNSFRLVPHPWPIRQPKISLTSSTSTLHPFKSASQSQELSKFPKEGI